MRLLVFDSRDRCIDSLRNSWMNKNGCEQCINDNPAPVLISILLKLLFVFVDNVFV